MKGALKPMRPPLVNAERRDERVVQRGEKGAWREREEMLQEGWLR